MKKVGIKISEEPLCKDLKSLGSIMIPIIRNALSKGDLVEADIMFNWKDIIGEEFATYIRPIKAKYNHNESVRILYVEVPVGGFALELQHKENYLLEKINAYFGYQAIHKINISQNANIHLRYKKTNRKKEEIELSEEDNNYIKELIGNIDDKKLKENLLKLAKSVIMANKGVY